MFADSISDQKLILPVTKTVWPLYIITNHSKIDAMLNISRQAVNVLCDKLWWIWNTLPPQPKHTVLTLHFVCRATKLLPTKLYVEWVMQSIETHHSTLHHPSLTVLAPIILLTLTLWTLNSFIPVYNFHMSSLTRINVYDSNKMVFDLACFLHYILDVLLK